MPLPARPRDLSRSSVTCAGPSATSTLTPHGGRSRLAVPLTSKYNSRHGRSPSPLGGGVRGVAHPRRRLRDHVGHPARAGLRRPTTASSPASTRTPGARTRRCTARSSGRCGCSPASARPTTRTGASRRSSSPAATGCRPRSTCRRCSGSTPTTRCRWARSAAAASPSTRLADMEDLYAGIDLGDDHHVDDDQLAGRGRSSPCSSPRPRRPACTAPGSAARCRTTS